MPISKMGEEKFIKVVYSIQGWAKKGNFTFICNSSIKKAGKEQVQNFKTKIDLHVYQHAHIRGTCLCMILFGMFNFTSTIFASL